MAVLIPGSSQTPGGSRVGWVRAASLAAAVVVAAYGGLAFVPNVLAHALTGRVSAVLRDVFVAGWVVVALVAVSWLLLWAQRREARP